MTKPTPRISPPTILVFTASFLATDYLLYKLRIPHINSLIWVRMLGESSVGTVNPPGAQ